MHFRRLVTEGDAPIGTQALCLSSEPIECGKVFEEPLMSHISKEVRAMDETIWTLGVGGLVVTVAISVAYLAIYIGC